MTLRSLLIAAALALAPLSACAKAPAADIIDDALAAAPGDRRAAALRLEEALATASDDEAAWIQLHLGEQYRLLGEARAARQAFRQAAGSGVVGASRGGELGLAVLAGEPIEDEALGHLRSVGEKDLPDTLNADRYLLLALLAADANDPDRTADLVQKALRFAASDPQVDARVRTRLEAVAGPRPTPGGDAPDPVARLDEAVAAGNRDRVLRLADELRAEAEATDDPDLLAIAEYADDRLDRPVRPRTVAVLLPLSGKYKGVGGQIRKALELGWEAGRPGRQLVFLDTGEDAASAVSALEEAVLERGAVAVLGPLRSELAVEVARVANALRTPLLGLHQDPEAADERPWVIDGLSTPEAQVEALVDYVMGVRGMEAFAIFAPDTPYGQGAADAFTAAVEAREGRITVREHYDPEATDLIPFAKKLGRKDYEGRAYEFREIKKTIEEAGGDPSRAVLPPVIDFDAIFLPDNRRRVPVAAAGLAYEEFPVGQFQIDKDGPTYPLLGLSGWNHPQLLTTGGPYVRDSLFVDVWHPEAPADATFARDFEAAVGRTPNTLEAQVWTAARIAAAAARAEAPTPEAFREALLAARLDAPTATGAVGVDTEAARLGHAHHVLTLDREGIQEIVVAPAGDAEGADPDGDDGDR
jgi:ABC-type branched-subunit amino acid transport system substrate-binding protein